MHQILSIVTITAVCLVAIAAFQAAVSFRFFSTAGRIISEAVSYKAVIPVTEAPSAPLSASPQLTPPVSAISPPASPPDEALPEKVKLLLSGVDEKTAAMLMAIVADEMGVPPDELRFLSIKECA